MCCLLLTQDAGLENMALEVGTVQGGQIAALQDGKDGALGKPLLRYTVRSFGRYIREVGRAGIQRMCRHMLSR